jgi:hypothetical protein
MHHRSEHRSVGLEQQDITEYIATPPVAGVVLRVGARHFG